MIRDEVVRGVEADAYSVVLRLQHRSLVIDQQRPSERGQVTRLGRSRPEDVAGRATVPNEDDRGPVTVEAESAGHGELIIDAVEEHARVRAKRVELQRRTPIDDGLHAVIALGGRV